MIGQMFSARAIFGAVFSMLVASPAFAAPDVSAPPPVPLVVDLEGVMEHSKAGESVTQQLTAHNKIFEREHARQEEKLKAWQQELEQEHATLSADVFEQKQNDFQQHVQAWQEAEQLNEQALGKATEVARDQTLSVLKDIIGSIALQRHANLVLLRSQVFFYANAYDISEEVLEQLDEKLPTLKVVVPKVSAPADGAASTVADPGDSGQ